LYRTGPAAALILGLALALASCGGGAPSTESTIASAGVEGNQAIVVHPDKAPKPAESPSTCDARLEEFLGRMDDLRQSLLAGLSYSEYVVRVRAIRDAYEAVPVDKLGVSCVTGPAGAAESAFNEYLRAANAWGECAGTAGCSASEVEGRLQRRWRIASKQLEAAEGKKS
jgi:hypothetical protein